MKRDLVFLDAARNLVSPRDAMWAVETFTDERGIVVRQTWAKVIAVRPARRRRRAVLWIGAVLLGAALAAWLVARLL